MSERFWARLAEQPLGARIPQTNDAVTIRGNDGVSAAINHGLSDEPAMFTCAFLRWRRAEELSSERSLHLECES